MERRFLWGILGFISIIFLTLTAGMMYNAKKKLM
jgi:hypothetical protein